MPSALQASLVGHVPLPSEAKRWRQRLDTANGLPVLMPTARVPCGDFSTTVTREAPRSATAIRRAAGCSKVLLTRGLLTRPTRERCPRPDRAARRGASHCRCRPATNASQSSGATRAPSRSCRALAGRRREPAKSRSTMCREESPGLWGVLTQAPATGVVWVASWPCGRNAQPEPGCHRRRDLRHEAGGGGYWF